MADVKIPLLGKTLSEIQGIVHGLGMPGFTAKQIVAWLYDKKVFSIDDMTNLSLKNRERLKENYEIGNLCIFLTKTVLHYVCPRR